MSMNNLILKSMVMVNLRLQALQEDTAKCLYAVSVVYRGGLLALDFGIGMGDAAWLSGSSSKDDRGLGCDFPFMRSFMW